MSIFLRSPKGSGVWVVFTDLMVGLFTLFVFAFVSIWLLKEESERDLVERNEAFTRKEQEYQACVDAQRSAQRKLAAYQTMLGEQLKIPIEKGQIALADDGKIDIQTSLLFASGHSRVTGQGRELLQSVARALGEVARNDTTFILMVAGHTDSIPVHSEYFKSNWDLSQMRARNVADVLLENGFPPARVFSAGFGEFQPKVSNATEELRSQNRRVEIVRLNRFGTEGAAP